MIYYYFLLKYLNILQYILVMYGQNYDRNLSYVHNKLVIDNTL